MNALPDHLACNLKILFVGYNPGERSAELGHHYAGRGNQFWRLLNDAGLTERLYSPEEDRKLTALGYGLTNLVGRPSKSSSDLSIVEMKDGAVELREKIKRYLPRVVCFLGKDVYRKYAGLKTNEKISYGLIYSPGIGDGVMEFVAPNPSGRSTVPYNNKLNVFCNLRELIEN